MPPKYSGPEDHVAWMLLSRTHSPDTASRIFREKVVGKPLFLWPQFDSLNSDARDKRRRRRQAKDLQKRPKAEKPRPLSAKQKRSLGVYDIPKEEQKYAVYVPLHRMWCEYMRGLLGLDNPERASYVTSKSAGEVIVSADFHGALVEVVRSRCASRVGLKGIIVKDTKFTFEMVTERDEVKAVPKEHTIFRFEVPQKIDIHKEGTMDSQAFRNLVFELHGSQFEHRAPDRAKKGFKPRLPDDL